MQFKAEFPDFVLAEDEVRELLNTGYVAVGVGNRRVFTVRLEVAESDIPEMDFSQAVRGKFYRKPN